MVEWGTYLARGVPGVVTPAALEALHDRGFVVLDGALGAAHAGAVAADAAAMSAAGALSPAKVTTGVSQRVEPSKRSDSIAWLKRPRGGGAGGAPAPALPPAISRHLSAVERVRAELEASLRCGAERCSFMLAEYPGGGGRYVRHRDAVPRGCAGRKLTVIYYLNAEWSEADGGCLRLWPRAARAARVAAPLDGAEGDDAQSDDAESDGAESDGERAPPADGELAPPVEIAPLANRLLIFESRLSHEVLPWNVAPEAGRARRAITAWLYDPKELALELLVEQSGLRADAQAAGKGGGSDRAALVLKLMAMRQQRGGAV